MPASTSRVFSGIAVASVLLDTGPVVAFLRSQSPHHASCRAAFEAEEGRFVSTEAVLTEAAYLVSRLPGGVPSCLDFFLRLPVRLVPMTPDLLVRCRDLTERYADVPMDFADATLVAVAEETGIADIFTLDRRGFSAYRVGRDRAFRIVPA
jgi:uncharacterized protein